jgi:hypothetical protein
MDPDERSVCPFVDLKKEKITDQDSAELRCENRKPQMSQRKRFNWCESSFTCAVIAVRPLPHFGHVAVGCGAGATSGRGTPVCSDPAAGCVERRSESRRRLECRFSESGTRRHASKNHPVSPLRIRCRSSNDSVTADRLFRLRAYRTAGPVDRDVAAVPGGLGAILQIRSQTDAFGD